MKPRRYPRHIGAILAAGVQNVKPWSETSSKLPPSASNLLLDVQAFGGMMSTREKFGFWNRSIGETAGSFACFSRGIHGIARRWNPRRTHAHETHFELSFESFHWFGFWRYRGILRRVRISLCSL
jgi:hypothetical protein